MNRVKGKLYISYRPRRDGERIRLYSPFGSQEFEAEYEAAKARLGGASIGAGLAVKGSVRSIVICYLDSEPFKALKPSVREKRKRLLERFAEKNATRMLGDLAPDDVRVMMKKIVSPHVQRLWRQTIRTMCVWAVGERLLKRNPMTDVEPVALPEATPHRRWMPEHVAAFRARWPSGTVERRALEFLICTMARGRSDISRLTRSNVRNGCIVFVASKNGEAMEIPISPDLAAEIAAVPATDLLFFRGVMGRPTTGKRFGEMFKRACKAAGLDDDLTAHGLRHAGAAEAAEAGASVAEIAALLGDRSWQMAKHYAEQAEKKRLIANYHARRRARKDGTNGGPDSQTDSQT
jgi:integrase